MRLESALYSSREGLTANGQAISVVGDNISNSNTTGFKTSRVEFSDLIAEGTDGYQATALPGGGSGVQISKVRQIHETGTLEYTARSLDVGVAGKGFFLVGDPAAPTYTRAGNFNVGTDGFLKSADGQNVLGYSATGTTLAALDVKNVAATATATSAAAISGNIDAASAITTAPTAPGTFNELASAASFIAPALSVYDSLGGAHQMTLYFFKTAANTYTAQAYIDGGETTGGTAGVPVAVGSAATLTFGTDGVIAEANQAAASIAGTANYANGAAAGAFTIDLSGFSQFAGTSQVASVTQDGKGAGSVQDYEFRSDGSLYAQLDNGQPVLIGRLPLATFVNNDGLQRIGNNSYAEGEETGERTLDIPGTKGLGTLQAASLENSTVDIADQFVNLIIFQRAYQASSQTLNAANGMLRDTLQLIR